MKKLEGVASKAFLIGFECFPGHYLPRLCILGPNAEAEGENVGAVCASFIRLCLTLNSVSPDHKTSQVDSLVRSAV
jgi:hypothetical protein